MENSMASMVFMEYSPKTDVSNPTRLWPAIIRLTEIEKRNSKIGVRMASFIVNPARRTKSTSKRNMMPRTMRP